MKRDGGDFMGHLLVAFPLDTTIQLALKRVECNFPFYCLSFISVTFDNFIGPTNVRFFLNHS